MNLDIQHLMRPGTLNLAGLPPLSLYIHLPWCLRKCPYCDFNSHVAAHIDQNRWKSAYLAEIARVGAETQGRVLTSVFFGGGTPSLMDPDLVAAILEKVRETWTLANDVEITMEANPGSAEAGKFAGDQPESFRSNLEHLTRHPKTTPEG